MEVSPFAAGAWRILEFLCGMTCVVMLESQWMWCVLCIVPVLMHSHVNDCSAGELQFHRKSHFQLNLLRWHLRPRLLVLNLKKKLTPMCSFMNTRAHSLPFGASSQVPGHAQGQPQDHNSILSAFLSSSSNSFLCCCADVHQMDDIIEEARSRQRQLQLVCTVWLSKFAGLGVSCVIYDYVL